MNLEGGGAEKEEKEVGGQSDFVLFAGGVLLSAPCAVAGPERVAFPSGYGDKFVRYLDVDRPDRKIKRIFYVNPGALESAEAGKELPYGTLLIMEDHPVELEIGETPRLDAAGRLLAERQSVGKGKDTAVRVDNGGRR